MRQKEVIKAINTQGDTTFKTVNNLLSLQDNHVEEFFQYHGEAFLTAMEKLMEDVIERVVSQMLSKLAFNIDGGKATIMPDAMREFERITQENIDLDIQKILQSALDLEVTNQRKMAKQQYLESQGFGGASQGAAAYGGGAIGGGMAAGYQMQGAIQNGSGYPVPPAGTDGYGRPYWIDPQTGQMSLEPPNSGLGLMKGAQKAAAWAKWLM
ncbi:MAG: hypothetical protein CL833_02760 [Crocinitomicaceae bacterium]|jgi:hypothetical protein|nr:hypothetical protein [Crocinitomicaceae bacterium]